MDETNKELYLLQKMPIKRRGNNIVEQIHMVDLVSQYEKLKPEIDDAIQEVCASAQFINGSTVKDFEIKLADYLGIKHVIGCANGTDALQVALMALDLQAGDEVLVPAFTYVATAEVIGLLKLQPVMVDVDPYTFNVRVENLESALSSRTKAIVPVHLFGQSADMEPIMKFAETYNLYVIEDNAQAIGADYTFSDGRTVKTGTIGDIGTTSFFPSKNLGCYGDGGAIFTNNDDLAHKMRMIANHGQSKRYYHSIIGCNSRLDSIQAAVLNVKLNYLNEYAKARQEVAAKYAAAFQNLEAVQIPARQKNSSHVFHQYTLRINNDLRDQLIEHLKTHQVPCGVYYPVPLYKQKAYTQYVEKDFKLEHTELLCQQVISLPIHTEMKAETQDYIIETVLSFFD